MLSARTGAFEHLPLSRLGETETEWNSDSLTFFRFFFILQFFAYAWLSNKLKSFNVTIYTPLKNPLQETDYTNLGSSFLGGVRALQ